MPKATEQYNLHVTNPGLAKEWHPTRNGDLNPRNVTPGSGKKVWWICTEGHEWQAMIYSRNRGSGCPLCHAPTPGDDADMLVSNKGLLKEWHLTKNSGLNLRNLPVGFNKKVWWICEEGHEWQATVKSRIKGNECPVCYKSLPKQGTSKIKKMAAGKHSVRPDRIKSALDGDIGHPSFAQLSAATGFRKTKRYRHRATVILEDAHSGAWSYAQTKDFSDDGMLLESEVAFKPGTIINIKFDTQPFKSSPKTYSSVVRWCKELAEEDSILTFGIGVKFT